MHLRILTSGRLGEDFAKWAINTHGLAVSYIPETALNQSIINEHHALAGFHFYAPFDIGHIQWIHHFGAGVDSFIHRTDLPKHLKVSRTLGQLGSKMGEYCLAYILNDLKEVQLTQHQQLQKIWREHPGQQLSDQSVLILGTGQIGQHIAQMLRPLVKTVTGINTSGSAQSGFDQCISLSDRAHDFSSYTIVINLLPHTSQTNQLINRTWFERFNDVLYINIGRGKTTYQTDLLEALERNFVRKAVLDVFEIEPLPENSPFWNHPKVVVTPHHSGITDLHDVSSAFSKALEAFRNQDAQFEWILVSKGY